VSAPHFEAEIEEHAASEYQDEATHALYNELLQDGLPRIKIDLTMTLLLKSVRVWKIKVIGA